MARSNLKRLFANDKLKAGHLLFEFSTPGIGQILKIAELDFVFVDMEHSGFGISELKRLITSLRAADLPALVRPPSKNYQHIARVLDVGADGLILPMVASAEEAREIIQHMYYPPRGHRGIALGIAHDGYAPQTPAAALGAANRRIAMTALIETVKGLENVDTIAAVPGVDCMWIGHFDLSASMGIPGQFHHPDFKAAVKKVGHACKKHKKSFGRLVPDVSTGAALFRQGFDFICYSGDVWIFQAALKDGIDQLRAKSKGGRPRGR